jgi:nucleoside-diphosphate-sugar epimerase
MRDVIYIEDFATAVVLLLAHSVTKYDIFNLGSGITATVGDVIDSALKHGRHKPAKIVYSGKRPTTIKFRALDCEKIKQTLEWEPSIPLDEGINRTTEWFY